MISKLFIPIIGLCPLLALAEATDLLRFDNGDQLHGQFQGFGEEGSILWKRDKTEDDSIKFDSSDIRQVILKSGKPAQSLANLAYIGTCNGDRIQGTVQEIDDKRIFIQTDFAGLLDLPRDQVEIFAPNPMGGRVLYYGPFDKTEWTQKNYKHMGGIPNQKNGEEIKKEFPLWEFNGSAWYWNNANTGTALIRDKGMTDRSILQFDLAWKKNLSATVAFHADFSIPKNAKQQEYYPPHISVTDLPYLFGSSYVLQIISNNVVLFRVGFDEEGTPAIDRLDSNNFEQAHNLLRNLSSAKFEIRCNRISGEIILFVDGKHICEWSEAPVTSEDQENPSYGYKGKGPGYGFIVQMQESPLRVSDIIVAEWNGMPDSARSLDSNEFDIVLLNNGTDRFSGKIKSMKDGKVSLTSRFGNFSFPIEEIAEIRFAKSQLKVVNDPSPDDFKVRFYPLGSISGEVVSGDSKSIRLLNTATGEITVDLQSASMLDFKSTQSYLDDWNVEF
jgi:hypothetical protein